MSDHPLGSVTTLELHNLVSWMLHNPHQCKVSGDGAPTELVLVL